MRPSLLDLLIDPSSGEPLQADALEREGDEIVSGELRGGSACYPIRDGIPRLVAVSEPGQDQTRESFGYKWTKRDSFGSEGMRRSLHAWLVSRYGFADAAGMRAFFRQRRRTLDAGCGAGFATSAWMTKDWSDGSAEWVGADISAAIDVARDTLGSFPHTHFVQADVMRLPFRERSFDAIISEGVLHHTPSTHDAFMALVPLLAASGELMIYVYRKKSPVREFTDDFVRQRLTTLPAEEAWAAMRPLTELARALAELNVKVDVPEDVPLLEIAAGRYDVQRLIYWHFAKLYWNPELEFEENVHVNFDWYAPAYAHRHTEEEVRGWYDDAQLEITHFDAQEAGFTVRGVKR